MCAPAQGSCYCRIEEKVTICARTNGEGGRDMEGKAEGVELKTNKSVRMCWIDDPSIYVGYLHRGTCNELLHVPLWRYPTYD